jgi:predicted enzyme related to lactoylglutathione lyase
MPRTVGILASCQRIGWEDGRRVANLDRLLAELKSEGVAVDEKVQDESYGKFGWATDPEGNRFELWEPK